MKSKSDGRVGGFIMLIASGVAIVGIGFYVATPSFSIFSILFFPVSDWWLVVLLSGGLFGIRAKTLSGEGPSLEEVRA